MNCGLSLRDNEVQKPITWYTQSKSCQPNIIDIGKLSFKSESEIKIDIPLSKYTSESGIKIDIPACF